VDLTTAALAGAGATGADVEKFVRGARRRARDAGRLLVLEDLLAEMGDGDKRGRSDMWIAAAHEAGHAVAWLELRLGTLSAVSLRAVGSSGGVTVATGSRRGLTESGIRRRLIARLAGRASEEILLGEPTSGAGGDSDSDLAIATRLAVTAATALGLDPHVGLLWSGLPSDSTVADMLQQIPGLAVRIRQVVDAAYAEALALIRRRAAAVEALAAVLLDRLALDGHEVEAIVARHPGPQQL